jgi:hypothetical protein
MPLALLVTIASVLAWPATASAAWIWPVKGGVVSHFDHEGSGYGAGMHRGIDIAAGQGSPVVAATGGRVTFVGRAADSGLTVGLRTSDGRFDTSYLHLAAANVEKAQTVDAGTVLGLAGASGRPSSHVPHVHFGVREAGTESAYRDPLDFLNGKTHAPPAGGPLVPRGPVAADPLPSGRPLPSPEPELRTRGARRPAPAPSTRAVTQPVPATPRLPARRVLPRMRPAGERAPGPPLAASPVSGSVHHPERRPLRLPARAPLGPGAETTHTARAHPHTRRRVGSPDARAAAGGVGLPRLIGAAAAFALVLILVTAARRPLLSSIARRWATTSQRRSIT